MGYLGAMIDDDDLVPVFNPPLALVLAHGEKIKGSPLTEAEVLRMRDRAICTMTPVDLANETANDRGYRDVNPENCWADWHRLRVQLTGSGSLPRIILCLLAGGGARESLVPILEEDGSEYELSAYDQRMVSAFRSCVCPAYPSLTDEDYQEIVNHKEVLYVLSKNFTAQEAPAYAADMLRLGARLLEAGALAMKCESSGIAHSRTRWLELAEITSRGTDAEYWTAQLQAYVQLPIASDSGDEFYTCGMHLIGLPDLLVSNKLLQQALAGNGPQTDPAIDLFLTFALYLLVECPDGSFASGHTFRPTADWPKLTVLWQECNFYETDHFYFNPFGFWRFAGLA